MATFNECQCADRQVMSPNAKNLRARKQLTLPIRKLISNDAERLRNRVG